MNNGLLGTVRGTAVPYCRVSSATSQNSATGTLLEIAMDAVREDNFRMFDLSLSTVRIWIRKSGVYHIDGGVQFAASATGYRDAILQRYPKDGPTAVHTIAEQLAGNAGAGIVSIIRVSTFWRMNAGDSVTLGGVQNSGTLAITAAEFGATYLHD